MGKKRKGATTDLLFELSKIIVPTSYLTFFEVVKVNDMSSEWQVNLHEKEHLIPPLLKDSPLPVLDGFCNPIHILSHAFSLKPVSLILHRRRWKESNTDKHYSNEYTLTKDSARITPAMADFLKR